MIEQKNQAETQIKEDYTPNKTERSVRVIYVIASTFLLIYGTVGVIKNRLFIPGKRTEGAYLLGLPAWIMFGAFLCAIANMMSIVIDHYDKRNNEIKYKKFLRITFLLGIALLILSTITQIFYPAENKPTYAKDSVNIPKDTIHFGTYYNSTIWSEMGYAYLEDDKNKRITHFKNDTTYKIKVSLTGKHEIPFRVASLTPNVTISPIIGEKDTYLFNIKKQISNTVVVESNKTSLHARLALIANTDSIEYYLTDSYWTDSSKIRYKEIT